MTEASQELTERSRLRFERYVLDFERGCLTREGEEIALRPKTFAVLRYLAERPGRLVSKDELFAAVWPNLAITDDVLVQSIGELRRALGDDGQRLVRTVPRRGYRFEAAVVPDDPALASAVPAGDTAREPLLTAARVAPSPPKTTILSWRTGLAAALALLLAIAALGVAFEWQPFAPRPVATPRADTKAAIAVLPFANHSEDAARDYFADGVTQDIINALGRFSALTVMSWNAVFPYKGKPANPREIAQALSVRYLLEGSVRQTADRVRVIAQLVDMDGRVIWSARFDEALADVFALQDRITSEITGALAIRVTQSEQQRVLAKPTASLEAYDYVLRARPAAQRPTRASNAEARVLLRRAIQLDPKYAAAYAALAETYYVAVSMGWAEAPADFMKRAEEFAKQALSLNETEVRAHIVLGRNHILYNQYEQARAELDRAHAINPNDAHALAGRGNILMWLGQTDAAIETLELAQRIDPELNTVDRFALSLAYYLKRRYDAAIDQADLVLRRADGMHVSRIVLAAAYAQQNRPDNVARAVEAIRRVDPTFDAQAFGTKFLNPADLEHLRDGMRKAGLYAEIPEK